MKKLSYLTALVVVLALITVCSQTEGPTSPEAILSLQKSGDDDDPDGAKITINLFGAGPGAGATGTVTITDKPSGPDKLKLKIEGLPPKARITVFLTRHQGPGALPAQFIGEFTTNKDGEGKLKLNTEIVNAFASANQTREDAFGEAPPSPPPSPGTLPFAGGTANTIPLNWLRGYFVDIFPHNVFGPDENTPGGAIAFLSTPALP